MTFKLGPYRAGKNDLIKHLRRFNNDVELISFYCAASSLPVAAAIMFCLEEFPEHKERLEKKLEVLREFYGYTEFGE